MNRWSWSFLVATVAVAAAGAANPAALAWAVRHPVMPLVCLALAILSEVGRVQLSRNVYVSGGALVAELAMLVMPPPLAALVMGLGTLAGQRLLRLEGYRIAFNAALIALCAWLGGAAFAAVGGQLGMPVTGALLVPYLVMIAVYNGLNVLVLGAMLALRQRKSPVAFWLSIERAGIYNQVVFAVVGLFIEAIYFQLHLLGLVFIFGLLLAVRVAFQLYAHSKNFYREIVEVLGRALTFKDPSTGTHAQRVADLATEIGRELGFVERELELLRHAALMHDVGKVAVPDAILGKPGRLTPDEKAVMDRHVTAADDILSGSRYLEDIADMVRAHHERPDGQGYPHGSAGEEIPLAARIIAVADAYDAMTSDRPYRAALPEQEVILRLLQGVGSQFDPRVVRALFRLKGYVAALEAQATPLGEVGEPAPLPPPALPEAAGDEQGRARPAPRRRSGPHPS